MPDRFVEMYVVARDWWRNVDVRLLPGEEGRTTVFVVDFRDGCQYFGYTRGSVVGRVGSLMIESGGWGCDAFCERLHQRWSCISAGGVAGWFRGY